MNIEITRNPADLHEWCIDGFAEAYSDGFVTRCAAVFGTDEDGDEGKTRSVVFRIAIEKGSLRSVRQKYAVFLRFYSFGDMATADVVSLDKETYKEITDEQLARVKWEAFTEDVGAIAELFEATTSMPFLVAGGSVATDTDKIAFYGAEPGYGDGFFFADADALAAYAASVCGMTVERGNVQAGEMFIRHVLAFMQEFGRSKDFYERLVDAVIEFSNEDHPFTPQHVGSILIMKVCDRDTGEKKSRKVIAREEVRKGILPYLLAATEESKKK